MSEGTRVEGRQEIVGAGLTALQDILAELQTHTTQHTTMIAQNTTIIQELQLLNAVGVKTLYGAIAPASTDDINNPHAGGFTLTKLVLRETIAFNNSFTLSLGTIASPTLYINALPLTSGDFVGGELTIDTFASYASVAQGDDFRMTLAGAATLGQIDSTLIGVI